jgi:hypothetical protein
MMDFLASRIAGPTPAGYDRLFIQVSGDTGLVLATLGTDAGFTAGTTEGAGLRWTQLAERYSELSKRAPQAFESEATALEAELERKDEI